MKNCWNSDPDKRPSSSQLINLYEILISTNLSFLNLHSTSNEEDLRNGSNVFQKKEEYVTRAFDHTLTIDGIFYFEELEDTKINNLEKEAEVTQTKLIKKENLLKEKDSNQEKLQKEVNKLKAEILIS
nr:3913_t:CDS:2 [Entrophospora candida]